MNGRDKNGWNVSRKRGIAVSGMKRMGAVCLCAFLLSACGQSGTGGTAPAGEPEAGRNWYPEVPRMITSPEEIRNYLAEHYWDRMPDSASFEKAFAGYIMILQALQERTPSDTVRIANSVNRLFGKAASAFRRGDRRLLLRLAELGEKYMYHPNSPLLNEELYLFFLQNILSDRSGLDSLERMAYVYQQRMALLNRVGKPARDFAFVRLSPETEGEEARRDDVPDTAKLSGDGKMFRKGTLYGIRSEYTLIFFNNPDCTDCARVREMLKTDPLFRRISEEGRIKVLAMYIDEDRSLWQNRRGEYPPEWIYACDPDLVLRDNQLYALRAVPSLYLLDREKRVVLKDARPERVLEYLASVI